MVAVSNQVGPMSALEDRIDVERSEVLETSFIGSFTASSRETKARQQLIKYIVAKTP